MLWFAHTISGVHLISLCDSQPSIKQCQQWTWVTTQQTTQPDNMIIQLLMHHRERQERILRLTLSLETKELRIYWLKHWKRLPDEGRGPRIVCPISTTTSNSQATLRRAYTDSAGQTSGGLVTLDTYVGILKCANFFLHYIHTKVQFAINNNQTTTTFDLCISQKVHLLYCFVKKINIADQRSFNSCYII